MEIDANKLLWLLGLRDYENALLAEQLAQAQRQIPDPHTGNAEAGQ
jgi:hypothetical protein